MKKLTGIILIVLLIAGCKKDNDVDDNNNNNKPINTRSYLKLNMTYQSSEEKLFSNQKALSDTVYSQFGNYITSISPTVFIGKFLDMRLLNWDKGSSFANYGFNVIDNNVPENAATRLANFSSNATVNFDLNTSEIPADSINSSYNIYVFISLFFYQEFQLPVQYDTVSNLHYLDFGGNENISSFDGQAIGGIRNGRTVKGGNEPFLAPIFDSTWIGFNGNYPNTPKCFVFGSSDSTYMYFSNTSGQSAQSIDNPLGQDGYIVRSNAFTTISIPTPSNGETQIVNGNMNFNSQQLIQVYAGADNIPYTSDDIFVYAPNYWERLSVSMTAQ